MIVRIINRSISSLLDELTLIFLQDNIPDIASEQSVNTSSYQTIARIISLILLPWYPQSSRK